MPEEKYVSNVYKTLKENYPNEFTTKPEVFEKAMASDTAYAKNVYGQLKELYPEDFKTTEENFIKAVGTKQVDPYAPKPVNFGKTTSVSPIVPEQKRDFTQLKNLQAQNEKWTNEKKVMAAHIDNMKESLAYTNPNQQSMFGEKIGSNKAEVASYVESLDQMTTSVKENNDKQIAILTKVFDKDIKPNYKEYVGKAGYGGIEVPNAGKVQEYTDNLMKEMGVDNADDNKRDFIKNAANQYISSLNTYERITPKAEHIFKQNTGKSIKEAMDEEQEKLYAPIIEIDNQYKAQSKMLPKIVDAQYKDEMAQIGVDAEHLNKQIEMESAQVDQHFAEMGKQLQAASVNMNQQQYDAAVAILNQQYKEAKAEKYDNYTMAFGAVVAQEAKINNQRKTDYDKQNQLNYNAYVKKRDAEVAKLSKNKNYSKEFTAQYEKAYNEAYDLYNSLLVKKLNKNQDEDNVAHIIGINAMKSMATSLNNMAKSMGLRGLSDGLEKVESGIQPAPKQMGDALDNPNTFKGSTGLLDDIKINLKVTASDLFSKTGAATAGQITGSGALGMAMAAGSAYVGNAFGVSEGLTMAAGGLISWAQETHDIKKSIYNQVYANTNDVQLAEQAADIGFESQLYIMGLNMVQMAKFMPDAELLTNMVKNPMLRRVTVMGAEQVSNTIEEFYQNAFENSVTNPLTAYQQKTFNDAGKYFTVDLLKKTAIQTLPMIGQSAVITFASGAGKGLGDIQKYRADKLQQMRADALLSRQIAEMGDNFGAQQLTQFYDVQGGAQTITSITQLQAKGKITAEKATELIGALLNHDRHNLEAKKLSLQGSNLYAYTGLRQKQDEVERDLLTAATEEEKTTLNGRKTFIQGLINELTTKGTADIVLFRYKNGVQLTMTQGEATKLLMQEGAAQHIEDAGVEVVAMGKTQEPIQQLVKEITANRSKQEAQTTSDTQTETEQSTLDNNVTQTETQPQTAEQRAAAILAQVKRKPKTEAEALQAELKTVSDQEERTNIGEQITLHETKAQHEGKVKEIADKIVNLSENGKVVENLDKINALAADKKKIEESISDIEKQIKTKQNERETKAKGREKASLLKEKTWHDLAKDDRITVNGVGASVSGVNQNMNGAVHSIDFTLDDGTKGEATILGNDILDANGKPLLIKNEVIQSEKAAPAPSEHKTTSDNQKPTESGSVGVGGDVEIKNEGKADAPTKESVTERLNINNPFYKKVEDALVKLGLIEKYNAETGTGDVVGGYAQQTSDGGFSVGKMLFSQDGSISYFDGDVKVSFDKNGNVISENTKEAKQKANVLAIESKKESIDNLEKTRDSEAFKYKEVTETDILGNKKKVKRLKTEQELKDSTDKINAAIDKAKAELSNLEQSIKETTKAETIPTTSNQSEIEAKKADIERRRQEELNNKAYNIEATRTEYKLENGLTLQISTYADGSYKIFSLREGEIPNQIAEGKNSNELTQEYLEDIYGENFPKGTSKPIKTGQKDKINAKYDSELKALEQPTTSNVGVEEDSGGVGVDVLKDTVEFHKKDNERLKAKGEAVVDRNKNRIDGNDLMVKFSQEAKTVDNLYDIAREHFDNERKKLKERYGNNLDPSQSEIDAYSDLSKTENYVFNAIDGTNAEANPEMAARIKADAIAKEEDIKNREQKRTEQSLKETTKAETKVTSDNQTQKGKATSGNNVNQSEKGEQKTNQNDNTTDKGRPTKGDRGVQDEASGVGDGVPTKKEEAAAKGEAKQTKLEYIQEDQIPESVMVDVLDAKGNNVKVMDSILGRDGKKIGQELVNKQAPLTKKDVIKKQREISNKENRLINLIDCITKKKK